MIFYRSPASQETGPSLAKLRSFITVALLAYPAGCLVMLIGPLPFNRLIGLGLIAIALFSAVPVIGSRMQRIVGDEPKQLDEMELQLREKAMTKAYSVFTALFLAAIAYAGVASDIGWWQPSGFENWNAIFWGVFLYAVLLPTAFLTWTMPEERD